VMLPPRSDECISRITSDPLDSSYACEIAEVPLSKFIQEEVKETEPNLYKFFLDYFLSSTDMNNMLRIYQNTSTEISQMDSTRPSKGLMEEAACRVRTRPSPRAHVNRAVTVHSRRRSTRR